MHGVRWGRLPAGDDHYDLVRHVPPSAGITQIRFSGSAAPLSRPLSPVSPSSPYARRMVPSALDSDSSRRGGGGSAYRCDVQPVRGRSPARELLRERLDAYLGGRRRRGDPARRRGRQGTAALACRDPVYFRAPAHRRRPPRRPRRRSSTACSSSSRSSATYCGTSSRRPRGPPPRDGRRRRPRSRPRLPFVRGLRARPPRRRHRAHRRSFARRAVGATSLAQQRPGLQSRGSLIFEIGGDLVPIRGGTVPCG